MSQWSVQGFSTWLFMCNVINVAFNFISVNILTTLEAQLTDRANQCVSVLYVFTVHILKVDPFFVKCQNQQDTPPEK